MKRAVLFDLDGTLWDSSIQVVSAWNEVLDENKLDHITVDDMQSFMGRTIDEIGRMMLPSLNSDDQSVIMNLCCKRENDYLKEHGGILYVGLEDTLNYLKKKFFLAIVSNCQDGYIQGFLKYHRLSSYFDDFECSGRTGKQKGENIKLLLERAKINDAVFVGDTQKDLDAADYAGIPFIHAAYGFGNLNRETQSICSITELKEIL